MAYMNRDDRRAGIVEAAARLILSDGLGAATVRGVAKALGTAPGQIHHHFASADELRAEGFKALWRRTAPDFQDRLAAMPPKPQLIAALLGDDPEIEALVARLWTDSLVASAEGPHVRDAVREAMEQWLLLLVRAIDAGRGTGAFVSTVPSDEMARRLAALCVGMDVFAGLGLPAHSRAEMRARIEHCVALQLDPPVEPHRPAGKTGA